MTVVQAASAQAASSASTAASAISLKAIGKRFGSTRILERIDLEIKHGELCVFVGPSGCGKSTLLRIIAGLESATSGDLSIDGKRVNDVAPSYLCVSIVFIS
jgi:ABC-type sugar transport system ATPase subunit